MNHPTSSASKLSYLPFIYIVWADGLLTDSELEIVRYTLRNDSTLREQERTELFKMLDPQRKPDSKTFKNWKESIQNNKLTIDFEKEYPLSDYAIRHARKQFPDFKGNEEGLQHIEHNLGLQPGQYRHFFQDSGGEVVEKPSFDSHKMRRILDGSYDSLIRRIQKVLKENELYQWELVKDLPAIRLKTNRQVVNLGEKGFGPLAFPGKYGGTGDLQAYGHIFENLIYAGGSTAVKFGVQYGLFGGSIANLGSQKHHDAWLRDLGRGQLLGCFAMTEEDHGSNVRNVKTTATYKREQKSLVVHTPAPKDCKIYIGGAGSARLATVFAQLIVKGTNHGVHAVVVPLRDEAGELLPGIRIEDNGYKAGLNGVDNGRIWFDQVEVPVFNLLDRFGSIDKEGKYHSPIKKDSKRFFTMLGTLVGGRICVGKGAVGGSKLGLAIAIRYAYSRRQFGKDIHRQENLLIEYPTHQMRLFPRLAKTYALHFALENLMERYANADPDDDVRELEAEAAALKSVASWHGNDTLQECREACGGKGYMSRNRIPELKADLDIFATFEGDNYVILQLAAKGVLSSFQTDFSADSFFGVIKFLRRKWADTLVTYNPIYTNNVDVSHLYSREFHREAFSYRRRRLTFSLAQRMNRMFKKRVTPYEAFLKVQTHMIQIAQAYAEERCLLAMHQVIEKTKEEDEKFMLKKLSALYALSTIYDHHGWYLEQGYISGTKSKAIRQLIHRHVQQMVPDGPALVEAFGIPEQYLELPLLG
ncbi:acyl-CoA dehydrogenase family protein [Membranicola marinus]|uniref:acyl-CoA oxidase n=1 Tax=Membranihabitans marinus TaxID=1227546 RepID=A0A953HXQ5_9BACT|nr:acyl-CoA dehydrogenase [Membranihabitans marinus]MBY5957647.1 acyl-CoA dehydrogenase family protein [Membranihabitans marinus]